MKKASRTRLAVYSALLLFSTSASVIACKPSTPVYHADFDFFAVLSNGRTFAYLDETNLSVNIREINSGDVERTYTFSAPTNDYLTVNRTTGAITLKGVPTPESRKVAILVHEEESDENRTCFVEVRSRTDKATGGFNFASNPFARTEALGKLEDYAMNNFLTGISLFENGGYVRYSPRVELKTKTYIPGYGFGLLSEGKINDADGWLNKDITERRDYYHTASSSDPLNINAWDASGSQISDLNGYISSSYWGTKINPDKTSEYMWYPVLADEDCLDPIAVSFTGVDGEGKRQYSEKTAAESKTGSYKIWRVYVRANDPKVRFHTADGAGDEFKNKYDNQMVRLEDYEFVFKMLLTGSTKLKRGAELATDTSYGFKGAISYYNSTKNYSSPIDSDD